MLPPPAQPALDGKVSLKNRCRIGKDAVSEGSHQRLDTRTKLLQAPAHDLVVVAPAGIHGHHALRGDVQAVQLQFLPVGPSGIAREVGHVHRNHAERARNKLGRAGTHQAMALHVKHVAVVTPGQPFQQMRFCRRQINTGDAQPREPQFPGPRPYLLQPFTTGSLRLRGTAASSI